MPPKTKLPVVTYDDSVVGPEHQTAIKSIPCQGCELEKKGRVCGQGTSGEVDIMFVSESPSSWSVGNQEVFYGRGGRVIRSVWKNLKDLDARTGEKLRMRYLRKWDTYAVQCQVEEGRDQNATASKSTIDRCSQYLHSAIKNKRPKIIVAFGATALKSLGHKGEGFMDSRGRVLELEIAGHTCKVIPTFSTKHIQAKTGLYNLFFADFTRAVRIAAGVDAVDANVTLEEITKDYRIPRTVAEVAEVCDEIINHVVEGAKTASQCAIAVDTETNTVNPHRKDAKVLCVSFAWDTGKATAIPLFHNETPWTKEEFPVVVEHVRRVLECAKPKVFHNCLTEDTRVTMADGSFKTLGCLVRTRSREKVLTLNESTGVVEPKRITNWLRGELREWNGWRRVVVRGKGVLNLTIDHEVLTQRGRVRADQLREGDEIASQVPVLTAAQRAVLFGSTLGDASIVMAGASRSPHFLVRHKVEHRAYVDFKAALLGELIKKISVGKRTFKGFDGPKDTQFVEARTRADRRLHELYDVTGKGKRRITREWLSALSPAAIAVWYMDAGCLQGGSSASICVSGFGKTGADMLVEYLRGCNWPARLDRRKDGHLYIKVIGPRGPEMALSLWRWWSTIAPFVPPCMRYKLPLRFRDHPTDGWSALCLQPKDVYYDRITQVGPLLRAGHGTRYGGMSAHGRKTLRQWCIEVEDNHNFFANGLAVSNCKFDLKMLEMRHGWRVNNVQWDSMLGEHLLREDMGGNYGLKTLGRSYFPAFGNYADHIHELAEQLTPEEEGVAATTVGVRKGKIPKKATLGIEDGLVVEISKKELDEYIFGKARDRKKRIMDAGYERVPIDTLLIYAAVDTDLTRRLLRHQFARMQSEGFVGPARSLMATHCVPASRALGRMEFDGFRVDRTYLEQSEAALAKVVAEKQAILRSFWDKPDEPFNPNSTAHVGHILFMAGVRNPDTGRREIRQGPWLERNKKSQQYKTDKKTLKAIAEKLQCPFSKHLLEYRAADKALNGFLHEIKLLSEYDNYLHTSFHLHGTSTGRTSSSKINMQNLTGWLAGVNIKKIFIPDDPEEEIIFNVDWKGAEIRVFTAYAPDEELIKALNSGLDVHSWFTQEIFGIPYADVERLKDIDKQMKATRTTVKRVVFGILYGAMAKKIAETAGISEEAAQQVIDKLFVRFPSLRNYMDEVVAQIHVKGFVETLFGRRRRFPLQGVNGFFRGQAERRGKNMKIQSTSSDIVIGQLVEIFEHIHELGGRLCITVHDSIVGTIKKKYLHQVQAFFDYYCVTRVREKYPWLPVDFAHDISVGPTYGETIALDDYTKKYAPVIPTDQQAFDAMMDLESLEELREDEDEAREAMAALGAAKSA
jgi:uracil-DNA glycosylase family 4